MKQIPLLLSVLVFGTPVVLRAQAGPPLAVDPKPLLQIGASLGDSDAFDFTNIVAIGVVGDSIFVLDGTADEVRIFNHRGALLGRIGNEGEGPGEFMWPTNLRLVPDGFVVTDLRLLRQSTFSLGGRLIRTAPLGHLPDQQLAAAATMRNGVEVAETAVSISETGAFPTRLIVVLDSTTQRVDTLARYSTGYVPYVATSSYGFLPFRAGSEGRWAAAGDSVLVVVSEEPSALHWWSSDPRGLSERPAIGLPLHPTEFTDDDKRTLIEKTNEQRRKSGDELLPRSVRVDAPQYWGQVEQLVISDHLECWIQWQQPRSGEDQEWFRVDLRSRQLSRLSLPRGFKLLAVHGDRLYGYVLGQYDAPVLTVFQIHSAE